MNYRYTRKIYTYLLFPGIFKHKSASDRITEVRVGIATSDARYTKWARWMNLHRAKDKQ